MIYCKCTKNIVSVCTNIVSVQKSIVSVYKHDVNVPTDIGSVRKVSEWYENCSDVYAYISAVVHDVVDFEMHETCAETTVRLKSLVNSQIKASRLRWVGDDRFEERH